MTIADLLKGSVFNRESLMRQGIYVDVYTISEENLRLLDKSVIRDLEPYFLAYLGVSRPLEYSVLKIESAAKFNIGDYKLLYSAPVLRFKCDSTFMEDFYAVTCGKELSKEKIDGFSSSFLKLLAPVTEETYISGDWPERKSKLVNELDPSRVILTNVRYFFLYGCGYESHFSSKKPTHHYTSSDKKHVTGEEMVVEFVKRSDDARFARYLDSFSYVSSNKKILSSECYYVQKDLSLIFSESLINYKEIMRILVCLHSLGIKKVYCPGDGLGIGVMCGLVLKERGYNIEVRGSDKYLFDYSPVKLDIETVIDDSYFYLCVNSYSFCCKSVGKNVLVYDRQSPSQIDLVNRLSRTWTPVRPFMYTTNFAMCPKINYVSVCEFDRGPLANSVFMSLSDADDPFDKTVRNKVKIIDESKELLILSDNTMPVYFRGTYQKVDGKHVITMGRGRFSSFHYLSFPNDLMDACKFTDSLINSRNRNLIFWTSVRLMHLESNCVRSFKNGCEVSYLYFVTIPSGHTDFVVRYRRGTVTCTVTFVLGPGLPFHCRVLASEINYFNKGLCAKYVSEKIIGTPLQKLFMQNCFVPRDDMIKDCEAFCIKNCDHRDRLKSDE